MKECVLHKHSIMLASSCFPNSQANSPPQLAQTPTCVQVFILFLLLKKQLKAP